MTERKVFGLDKMTGSGYFAEITDMLDHMECKGVYIGNDGNYDFKSIDGNWVSFANCVAGSTLPLRVIAARHTSGATQPDAKDIIFLY